MDTDISAEAHAYLDYVEAVRGLADEQRVAFDDYEISAFWSSGVSLADLRHHIALSKGPW